MNPTFAMYSKMADSIPWLLRAETGFLHRCCKIRN
jgi:hypothetical protein